MVRPLTSRIPVVTTIPEPLPFGSATIVLHPAALLARPPHGTVKRLTKPTLQPRLVGLLLTRRRLLIEQRQDQLTRKPMVAINRLPQLIIVNNGGISSEFTK